MCFSAQLPLPPGIFLWILFIAFFSRFSRSHQKLVNRHLRTGFRTHLRGILSEVSQLWNSFGQAVLFNSQLLKFSHEAITVGANLKNHRVAYAFVTQFNSLLELINSHLGLTSLDEADDLVQNIPPVSSSSDLVGGDPNVVEEVSETRF